MFWQCKKMLLPTLPFNFFFSFLRNQGSSQWVYALWKSAPVLELWQKWSSEIQIWVYYWKNKGYIICLISLLKWIFSRVGRIMLRSFINVFETDFFVVVAVTSGGWLIIKVFTILWETIKVMKVKSVVDRNPAQMGVFCSNSVGCYLKILSKASSDAEIQVKGL